MPKAVIEYIVKSLVGAPERVYLTEKNANNKTIIEIHVDKEDLGKVIGKSGKIIKSIRSVVGLLFPENNVFVDVAN